ncbi:MAG: hypothetical protein HY720_12845 [Planctomycetes bacterium]|nr:hypothetical protein [Planctomycetota bacterium]
MRDPVEEEPQVPEETQEQRAEHLALLRECMNDKAQAESWRRFGEAKRRLEIEEARESTVEERLSWLPF